MEEVDTVRAVDYMDDGTPIVLNLTIDRRDSSAIFDFTGTGTFPFSVSETEQSGLIANCRARGLRKRKCSTSRDIFSHYLLSPLYGEAVSCCWPIELSIWLTF